ncbi:MAG: asparagine synthase (glutamine-hydrolyzing) [Bacteroidota bacterium]
MCGIAAIYSYRGRPVDDAELHASRDQMRSRGPDGEGLWLSDDRQVALGHRRLSIIDLSPAGSQPMHSSDGRYVIVFNGEIYNYRELRHDLERRGAHFRSTSDTEVLLELFARHGADMLRRLRGMFAFAIWDTIDQSLFLARDPYGIKPLYYADDGHTIRAASQVKAILAGGGVATTPDPAGHASFFLWGHIVEPHTLYREIRTLPAGSHLMANRHGISGPVPYASVSETMVEAERHPYAVNGSARDYLREALLETVRYHLVADVEVGMFLSSGLDSTTLAALATEEGGSLRTLTLGFEEFRGTGNDEVPLAEAVARHYGTDHRTIWISRAEFHAELENVLANMDQPSTDGVNSYFVSRAARQAGLKVAISGLGGDELFGGYPSFNEIPRFARWTPSLGRAGRMLRTAAAPVAKRLTSPKYAGIFEYGGSYEGGYLLRRGFFMPWELPDVLDPDLAREGWAELQPLLHLRETQAELKQPHLRVAALESAWYMRNQLLRDTDWASMAHSLEVRVPLVDWKLLRDVAPLQAAGAAIDKQMMASTPARPLPEAVTKRPKSGFFVPVRDWMLEGSDMSPADRGLRGWAKYVYERFVS